LLDPQQLKPRGEETTVSASLIEQLAVEAIAVADLSYHTNR